MRHFLSFVLLFSYIGVSFVAPIVSAQADPAAVKAPPFELILPKTARVNEAFDATVKALNADGSVNTKYEGSIFFDAGESAGATIPANIEQDPAKFQLSDLGQKVFVKGFKFVKEGTYEVTVFEDNENGDDISTSTSIVITAENTSPPVTPTTISITDPVAQDTVMTSSLTVGGMTKPTSTVNIYVGSDKKTTITSDITGAFSGTVSGLQDGPNTLKAEIVDGSGKVAGDTSIVVNYSTEKITISQLSVKEGGQVFAGSKIHLEAVGDPGLKSVTVQFGDKTIVLNEDTNRPGNYSGPVEVSSFEGEVNPVVIAESFQGTQATFTDLTHINIVSSSFENIKTETTPDKKVRFTFSLKTDLEEIQYFKIKYGKESGKYDKDVITHQKAQIKDGNQYTWYIPDLDPGTYYSTIIGLDKEKKELSMTSGEQTFDMLVLDAASTCFIDQVSGVTVKKSGSKSIISWDKLADAATYQIFKKDAEGEYTMIDEVTDTTYTLNIDMTSKEEVFEDFQIRATCKNGEITGEGAYSESVSVQTGPAAIVFMILMIASGIAFILMRRGYLQ